MCKKERWKKRGKVMKGQEREREKMTESDGETVFVFVYM